MHGEHCAPACECGQGAPTVTMPDGSTVRVEPAAGSGIRMCWGVAGAEAVVAAAGAIALVIALANYASLRPRVLRVCAGLVATGLNVANLCTFTNITALGRNVLGSATVNGGFLDSYADRGLMFGKGISPITSGNNIVVNGVMNGPGNTRVAVAVEGMASQ